MSDARTCSGVRTFGFGAGFGAGFGTGCGAGWELVPPDCEESLVMRLEEPVSPWTAAMMAPIIEITVTISPMI